jgi:hypothetical protein
MEVTEDEAVHTPTTLGSASQKPARDLFWNPRSQFEEQRLVRVLAKIVSCCFGQEDESPSGNPPGPKDPTTTEFPQREPIPLQPRKPVRSKRRMDKVKVRGGSGGVG